jgi:hypothetical protein
VDVRLAHDRVGAGADRAHDRSLGHDVAALDGHCAELEQRDRVALGRPDRHAQAAAREAAGEGDRARGRRANWSAHIGADVDAAVLAAGIWVVAEREASQNRTVDRPGPRSGDGSDREGRDDHGEQAEHENVPPSLPDLETDQRLAAAAEVVKQGYNEPR